ncbi:MAG TPA: single-stranded DNA-binding protein [Ornithinibacter sp.]|nr:single-stranded DNA-binding protein [Ornithinibacter sp.]
MSYVNSVHLAGRVTATGEPRTLPSGDTVLTLRVVVPRPQRRGRARAGVDTIDVACWTAAVRRSAARCTVDDHVEVEGALRRRFFRSGGSVASRYEVEARTVSRRRPDSG